MKVRFWAQVGVGRTLEARERRVDAVTSVRVVEARVQRGWPAPPQGFLVEEEVGLDVVELFVDDWVVEVAVIDLFVLWFELVELAVENFVDDVGTGAPELVIGTSELEPRPDSVDVVVYVETLVLDEVDTFKLVELTVLCIEVDAVFKLKAKALDDAFELEEVKILLGGVVLD